MNKTAQAWEEACQIAANNWHEAERLLSIERIASLELAAKNKKLQDLFEAQSQECQRLHAVQRTGAIVANKLADDNATLRALVAEYARALNTFVECDVSHDEAVMYRDVLNARAQAVLAKSETAKEG